MNRKFGLIILDGWGIGDGSISDAIANANTPFMDELMYTFPSTTLTTYGEAVGLPEGQMGNSEVGHLNIGAGRIVYQELTRINKAIREGNFDENPVLLNAIKKVTESGVNLHFVGLVSNGGVHSSQKHLYALCELAKKRGVNMDKVYVHAFTDGRDCDPKSGLGFIQELEEKLTETGGKVASIIGRYYAMDRDNRWERVSKAYHLLVNGKGTPYSNAEIAIQAHYDRGITDEFIEPCLLSN
ncbi:MAG: 2,3-bisphosphoglycerate-independent phosphoglycerate mutase, partial [Bacteroidetes bacterium]|nr:2,3-bisphosphoglycerate-independent phosphoglycerate mutase [Bacteroidota bacterium]